MKGLLLAGGANTRLHPLTLAITKQLLPVYDKPMIYYPLTTLMLAGIREVLVISTPRDTPILQRALGDGAQWGLNLSYATQESPRGIADAFNVGADFIQDEKCVLILGDNIFFGHDLGPRLRRAAALESGATIFAYRVNDPQRYGVVAFDASGTAVDIEEKPNSPKSDWAVTGIYFYDATATAKARTLKPSSRGELEITDLNRRFLDERSLKVERLGRGFAWLDTGTPEALHEASVFVRIIEVRQGLKIACPEEVALNLGYINVDDVARQARSMPNTEYGRYLYNVAAVARSGEHGVKPADV